MPQTPKGAWCDDMASRRWVHKRKKQSCALKVGKLGQLVEELLLGAQRFLGPCQDEGRMPQRRTEDNYCSFAQFRDPWRSRACLGSDDLSIAPIGRDANRSSTACTVELRAERVLSLNDHESWSESETLQDPSESLYNCTNITINLQLSDAERL